MALSECVSRSEAQQLNQQLIFDACQNLLKKNPGNPFILDEGIQPIAFPNLHASFIYQRYNHDAHFALRTGIYLDEDNSPLSQRNYFFNPVPKLKRVSVSSHSETSRDFQSMGFGAGLLLLSNTIIADAIRRYKIPSSFVIVAQIEDYSGAANGSDVSRKGWTSHFAQKLGYTQCSRSSRLWSNIYHGGSL